MKEANLQGASLIGTVMKKTDLTGAWIYGISAWDLMIDDKSIQKELRITPKNQPRITVDDLEIAQFIYLLLNNRKVRQVIDAVTSKVVLILGRFSRKQKKILDAIRNDLREKNYTPIIFDFDKPNSKDITGTIEVLARMARFIIADLTDPSSIPHELATTIPQLRTTPVLLLKLKGSSSYSMIQDFQWDEKEKSGYPWVIKTQEYENENSLIENLHQVIAPAETLARKYHGFDKAEK